MAHMLIWAFFYVWMEDYAFKYMRVKFQVQRAHRTKITAGCSGTTKSWQIWPKPPECHGVQPRSVGIMWGWYYEQAHTFVIFNSENNMCTAS